MDFLNKRIWITGASSGTGEALTKLLSQKGARLIISSRRQNELLRVKSQCQNPENITVVALDQSNYQSIPAIVNPILSEFDGVDILINNSGVSQRATVEDEDFSVVVDMMNVNFFGAAALTKCVLPYMIKQKSGFIVCMSSLAGCFGIPKRSGYAAAKHDLHGFFETLRAENYQNNISVMMVCPGYVSTQMAKNALYADGKPTGVDEDAMKKGLTPRQLAQKIIKGIVSNKQQINPGGGETFGIFIHRWFPRLFSKIIRNKG